MNCIRRKPTREISRNWCYVCLLLPLGLAGCNWSPTTLAVENVSQSRLVTPAAVEDPVTIAVEEATPATTPPEVSPAIPAVTEPAAPQEPPAAPPLQPKLAHVDSDRLVGQWRDTFFGTRTLTLNADGTATMVLEFDFAGRLVYGNRLEFDMKWSVKDAVVTIDILEGRPAKSAKSAMEIWGKRYVYLLDCVADHQVEMRTSDGSLNHVLRRISDDSGTDSR